MIPRAICVPDPAASAFCRVHLFHCHTSVQYEKKVLHSNLQKCIEITLRVHELQPTKQQSRKKAVPRADQFSWGAGSSHLFCFRSNDSSDVTSAVVWVGYLGQGSARGSEPSLGSARSGAGFEIAQRSGREAMSLFLFPLSPSDTAMSGFLIACQAKQFR